MQIIHQTISLPMPTNITAELTLHMLAAFRRHWRPAPYKKAGIVLMTITPDATAQQMLFADRPRERDERLQHAIDRINSQHGKPTVKMAAQLLQSDAQPLTKHDKLSPCYTTNLRDILTLKC